MAHFTLLQPSPRSCIIQLTSKYSLIRRPTSRSCADFSFYPRYFFFFVFWAICFNISKFNFGLNWSILVMLLTMQFFNSPLSLKADIFLLIWLLLQCSNANNYFHFTKIFYQHRFRIQGRDTQSCVNYGIQ